jgi:hypothetical protein
MNWRAAGNGGPYFLGLLMTACHTATLSSPRSGQAAVTVASVFYPRPIQFVPVRYLSAPYATNQAYPVYATKRERREIGDRKLVVEN